MGWLKRESRRSRKQRRNLKELYPDQVVPGYSGSCDRVGRGRQRQANARIPAHRGPAGFDFKESAVNEAPVRTLHRGEFLDEVENIVLIGGPGTGKAHPATAIRSCRTGSPLNAISSTGNDSYRLKNSTSSNINKKGAARRRQKSGPGSGSPDGSIFAAH